MTNTALISKIKSLDALTAEEKAELIALLNNTKKYGLVWEDKPEDVEELLRTQLPVLQEVPERRILAKEIQPPPSKVETSNTIQQTLFDEQTASTNSASGASTSSASVSAGTEPVEVPNHILIEGDNLHALTALTFTHEGKIDVIYIDPPYNTGNKDFKYNDRFVDREDSYRHSKWLSFMHKRLQIAKKLLSDDGIIFISIDDNEHAQLKLLCDEVFGEVNFVEQIIWKNKYGPGAMTKGFGNIHEYIISYTKKPLLSIEAILGEEEIKKYKNRDEHYQKRGGYITQPLATKSKDDRPNLIYPIIHKGKEIWPEKQWIWAKERLFEAQRNNQLTFSEKDGKWSVRFKQYLKDENGRIRKAKPISIFLGPFNQDGTKELESFFETRIFNNPKPTALVHRLISMTINQIESKKQIILDFFAGSGTTLHATMQLNAEDGGSRQCILVTNNENNIAEEVCYERNRRVIEGYTNSKGQWVEGLPNNNFRYFKTEFVGSAKTEANRRKLTRLSTALLQIKEDCYTDLTANAGFDTESCHISANGSGRYLVVIYHNRQRPALIEQLREWIKTLPETDEKIRMYAFSDEKEVLLDDFYDVAERIMAVPLPDAIYNAYRATFRKLGFDRKEPAKAENENLLPENPDEIDFNATDPQ